MTNPVLRRALAYAARGWPVFPCQPGAEDPRHPPRLPRRHHRSSSRSPHWFTRHPGRNLAIATGAPGPDVLDIDQHGHAGNGFGALARLRDAGLLGRRRRLRPHPQRRPARSTSPAPPSAAATCPATTWTSARPAATSWPRPPRSAAIPTSSWPPPARPAPWTGPPSPRLLHPQRQPQPAPAAAGQAPGRDPDHLARWVAAQPEGNRNAGLFWAANRALETDPAADLSPLAAAARQAGLPDPEITRTLDSARRTSQPHPRQPDHQAEVN